MQLRRLGNTGLSVTPIGLGLAALGRPGYINLGHEDDLESDYDVESMKARAHRVLDAAWEDGVRYFDAARSYGRAEEFLSEWLNERGHTEVTIGSKWGYTYTADWQVSAEAHEIKNHSIDLLKQQAGESKKLLKSNLHVYQIHSATMESAVLENQEVLEHLGELKAGGVSIGLSVSGPKQADVILKAIEIEINSEPLFDTCQATWNLLERSAGVALREAHGCGMGIIIKEGVANGRLTARNTDPDFSKQRELLEKVAENHSTTVDAVALAAVLAQPFVDTVLSGAASVEHLQSNVDAVALVFDPTIIEELSELEEVPEAYWASRSGMAWN